MRRVERRLRRFGGTARMAFHGDARALKTIVHLCGTHAAAADDVDAAVTWLPSSDSSLPMCRSKQSKKKTPKMHYRQHFYERDQAGGCWRFRLTNIDERVRSGRLANFPRGRNGD